MKATKENLEKMRSRLHGFYKHLDYLDSVYYGEAEPRIQYDETFTLNDDIKSTKRSIKNCLKTIRTIKIGLYNKQSNEKTFNETT